MKAKVNVDLCIGCTLCTTTCPDVFRMKDDKSEVYVDPVPAASYELCRQAAEECPVTAIEITE